MAEVEQQAVPRPRLHVFVRSLLFFGAFFLVVWLWIDPKLIFYAHGWMLQFDIYVPGVEMFEDVPFTPGAAVNRAAGLLCHYYAWSWLGAAIITLVAWLLCFTTGRFIAAVSAARWLRWLQFVPALVVFAQHGRYSQYLTPNLALVLALLLLYVYTRLPAKRPLLSLAVFVVFVMVIYAAAAQAAAVFVALAALFDLFIRRRHVLVVVRLGLAGALPYLASVLLINWPVSAAYRAALPRVDPLDPTSILVVVSLALIPLLAGADWLVRRILRRDGAHAEPVGRPGWVMSLATVVLLLVLTATVVLTSNPAIRASMRLNYFARQQMWPEVLTEARRIPGIPYWTVFVCHDVNRALYHVGRLPDDMFAYLQYPDGLLLENRQQYEGSHQVQQFYRRAEVLCEMGLINPAEHLGHSALELVNYNPTALKLLATVNMVKGLPDAAGVFLSALGKDFVYRDWARERLAWIEADPALTSVAEVQHLRALISERDTIGSSKGSWFNKELFEPLMEKNPRNRMAFEYNMGMFLLAGDLQSFAKMVGILGQFDYPEGTIPLHYEEAILTYTQVTGERLDLRPRQIRPGVIDRFEAFMSRLRDAASGGRIDPAAFATDFGDTYYYHYAFTRRDAAKLLRRPSE